MGELLSTFDGDGGAKKSYEERVWKKGETFSEYVHEKTILANRVPIEEGDRVEYLIEGIPDQSLRNQACVQRIADVETLMLAFGKVSLNQRERTEMLPKIQVDSNKDKKSGVSSDTKSFPKMGTTNKRCFNCGGWGHVAATCKQEIKSRACFRCGEVGHTIRDCPRRDKQQQHQPTETSREVVNIEQQCNDEFLRIVQYDLVKNGKVNFVKLLSRLDSGSPISFIKKKYVDFEIKRNNVSLVEYSGINGSKLNYSGEIRIMADMGGEGRKRYLY